MFKVMTGTSKPYTKDEACELLKKIIDEQFKSKLPEKIQECDLILEFKRWINHIEPKYPCGY